MFDFISKLFLVIVGTGLFGYLSYRRTRRDAIRQKSIEFIDEVSNVLNKPLSMLFGQIRSLQIELDNDVINAIEDVFHFRLSVRIKSVAYLDSESFWHFYFDISNELRKLRDLYLHIQDGETEGLALEVRSCWLDYAEKNGMKLSSNDGEGLVPPFDDFFIWNRAMFRITALYLSETTKYANK